jgi:hypothetical protein
MVIVIDKVPIKRKDARKQVTYLLVIAGRLNYYSIFTGTNLRIGRKYPSLI